MLVRSQDRRKITQQIEFYIKKINDQRFSITHFVTGANYGTYASKERAEKILDRLEERYKRHTTIMDMNGRPAGIYKSPTVFQMPEDKEEQDGR